MYVCNTGLILVCLFTGSLERAQHLIWLVTTFSGYPVVFPVILLGSIENLSISIALSLSSGIMPQASRMVSDLFFV